MATDRWQKIKELFHHALELDVAQRAPYLADACRDDADLRREVEELLESSAEASGMVEDAVGAAAVAMTEAREPMAGHVVGAYRIVSELGHGGMGSVYLAERADAQYRSRVAIKLLRGPHSPDLVARFHRERQILADLAHPNIAQLLDGGTTDDGVPYVVMEYVDGVPLDAYCDAQRLSIRARLELLRAVCEAVAFAHRNLVVHRDLKPGNILVTRDGRPKLLDFGVAKLLESGAAGEALDQTRTGVRLMTPSYASPEQLRGDAISVASDVYSLGVIAYKLLTGHLPYDLRGRSTLEMVRLVCEQEPTRPSTVVTRTQNVTSTSDPREAQTPGDVSQKRRLQPERLRRRLRGDLDTIVMTALRKEPERRYASVEAFAEDIRRHLTGLPVSAREDTWGYGAGKFVRRHALAVGAACVFALVLLGFAATMTIQARRIARERDTAQNIRDFMVDLFQVADPGESRGNSVTVREILDRGAERIRTDLDGDPQVRATLLVVMAEVYVGLGLYTEAFPLASEALAERRRVLGDEHPDVAYALSVVAQLHSELGEFDAAVDAHRGALERYRKALGDQHLFVASELSSLAHVLRARGDYAEAEAPAREAVERMRRIVDTADPDEAISLANSISNLAQVRQFLGDAIEAERLYREGLDLRLGLYGENHPDVGESVNNVATSVHDQGRLDEAAALYRRALTIDRTVHGEEHPDVATSLVNLGRLLEDMGDYAAADSAFRASLALVRKLHGPDHWTAGYGIAALASVVMQRGELEEAEQLYREAIAVYEEALPENNPYKVSPRIGLGTILIQRGRPRDAQPVLEEAARIARAGVPEDHWLIPHADSALGGCLASLSRYAPSESLLVHSYDALVEKLGATHKHTRAARARVEDLYEAWGKPDKAAAFAARASAR